MARELSPEQLAGSVARGVLAPVYLVAGAETLRVLECADAIRAAAREQGYAEREVFEVEAGELVRNRPGGTHGLENIGDVPLEIFVFEVGVPR